MAIDKKHIGDRGEEQAAAYLKKQGYIILETNWRFRKLEVDIIARQADIIVFVEVKTRSTNEFGEPESFVSLKKQRFIISAAHQYIIDNNIDLEARFDVISVLQINNTITVKHLQEAFYPLVK